MSSNNGSGGGGSRSRANSQQHHHHSGHRRKVQFPPQEYTDFTRTDLSLLAPILIPKNPREKQSKYAKRIKKAIADLPSHLHSKIPFLSSFCSMHSKLTAAPVISLFNSLREEIEDEIPKTWGPLADRGQLSSQKREMVEIVQHLAVLWMGPKVFKARFDREPRLSFIKEKPPKCCACKLVRMAHDFQTQVAMAGLFIGRIRQGLWENSKRVVWYMEWASAQMIPARREDAKTLMWDLGKKFRITRLGAEAAAHPRRRRKHYVEEDDDEEEGQQGPGNAVYMCALDRDLREDREKGPRKMIGSKSQADVEEEQSNRMRARASSLYSCTTSGGQDVPNISIEPEVDRIIALYQEASEAEFQDRPDDDAVSMTGSEYVDDNDPRYDGPGGEFHMTPSRVQSMLDRSFGGPWNRDEQTWI